MPSIVLVIGGMDCGGAQRVLADMANYLCAQGWRVTLATWSGPGVRDFYALSPRICRVWLDSEPSRLPLPGRARALLASVHRLRALLRNAQPQVVLSFIDVSNILTILAAIGLTVRVVVAERTHPGVNRTISGFWRLLRRAVYSFADGVVAQTQDAASWIERSCRVPVRVIPNPLRPLPPAQSQRETLIIGVGRLTPEKGFDLLLRAFARVQERFPQWRVCIIGEGPEREPLQRLAGDLQLGDRVQLLGQVADVESWMARAGLMLHPSRREGFPNSVLEAMAMGAAVVCADCRSGPAELITDGVNGRLVPVDDLEALVRTMSDLMADATRRSQLGAQAVQVRSRFDQAAIMQRWESYLVPHASPAAETRW